MRGCGSGGKAAVRVEGNERGSSPQVIGRVGYHGRRDRQPRERAYVAVEHAFLGPDVHFANVGLADFQAAHRGFEMSFRPTN